MMKFSTLNSCIAILFCFLINAIAQAQTDPTPQALPYSQNFSSLLSTSTTYPQGWQGDSLGTTSTSAFRLTTSGGDRALTASSTATITAGGVHNYNGKIGVLASASIDAALRLSIVTTGVNNISINFDVMTIRNPFVTGISTRINQVDLQYRVGVTGNFISVSGITNGIYQNITTNQTTAVTTPQNLLAKSFTLPAACNNQPIVQLRWVQRDFSGIGSRASFAVDNIVICTAITTPTISVSGPPASCNGQTAIYGATITNGGTPNYQWKKNGANTGTNISSLSISGLILSDQISCVLTSTASCVSTLTATSNTINIGVVGNPPTISSANIIQTCSGSIDLTITGGTQPYSVCWDTTNIANGPMFGVTLGTKICPGNPYCGMGTLANSASFRMDGTDAKNLSLVRGITYTFNVNASHPWHLSTDSVGANSVGLLTSGTTGTMPSGLTTVTLKPNATHPSTIYYPCASHSLMGYKIFLQSGYCVEDLTNIKSGTYSVIVTDANTCTATNSYTINVTGGPVTAALTSTTNVNCFGNANGAIDITPSGGSAPYTLSGTGPTFMVISQVKTHSHPQFGTGSGNGFTIDNVQGKVLTLIRGITYSFSVLTPGHPFFISTSSVGGPGNLASEITNGVIGSMTTNGTLTFTPNNTHPALLYYQCAAHDNMGWKINIVDQLPNADLGNCMAGNYILTVTNANGCSSSPTLNVSISEPTANIFYFDGDFDLYGINSESALGCAAPLGFAINNGDCNDANFAINPGRTEVCNGIDDNCDLIVDYTIIPELLSSTDATCFGSANGAIDLAPSGGTAPYKAVGTGPTFMVIAQTKNHSHPQFGSGSANGYTLDLVQGKELTFIRGITYKFSVLSPGHPFFISTSVVGGPSNLASEVTNGVTGSMTTNGILTFTPNNTHPALLYYQCAAHNNMGWKINIVNQLPNGDLGNCIAGNYSLFLIDANNCSGLLPAIAFIDEPVADTFYYDSDLDLYGKNSESALACSAPLGFVINNNDCNDANPAINPGQPELCNGIDDNCDLIIDYPVSTQITATTDATCYGYADGTIDLAPSGVGGIAPYSTSGDGPTFMVISQTKNHSHPQYGTGSANGFTLDNIQGKELTFIRGITYYFSILTPGHPFFISTSAVGGPGNLASEVTNGVTGSMTTNGTLAFTPNNSHPALLYYQCAAHNNMGWKINIVDAVSSGYLGNCISGNYSLYLIDANGCTDTVPVNMYIDQPAANLYYYDNDSDSFGINNETALGCTAPSGFTINNGDCNDINSDIYPGQTELCNGVDDNCDLSIDEGCNVILNITVFIEGYYNGSQSMQSTLLNQGESLDSTVCDSIIVDLHEEFAPYAILDSKTVALSTSGNAIAEFPASLLDVKVYIAVRMRNSIETWSKLSVLLAPLTYFNFTAP